MEVHLKKIKASAKSTLIISVNNNIIDMVAAHDDPTLAWVALKVAYEPGD
jgi:hypothetical protein